MAFVKVMMSPKSDEFVTTTGTTVSNPFSDMLAKSNVINLSPNVTCCPLVTAFS